MSLKHVWLAAGALALAGVCGCASTVGYRSEVTFTPIPEKKQYKLAVKVTKEIRAGLGGSSRLEDLFTSPATTCDIGTPAQTELSWDGGKGKVEVRSFVPAADSGAAEYTVQVTEGGKLRHYAKYEFKLPEK